MRALFKAAALALAVSLVAIPAVAPTAAFAQQAATPAPDSSVDLAPLRGICTMLAKACSHLGGNAAEASEAEGGEATASDGGSAAAPAAARGEIRSRQDALQTLDRVIRYLEQAEPGNPAPLLITRAKKLIGVSFLEIMADLAPNALDSIEMVTGKPPSDSE